MTALYDPMRDMLGGGQRPPAVPSLPPPERDSLLSQLAGKTLSGLATVGSVLDKTFGGRAIRGLLGGKPEELLSIIPGSDWMNLTDEKNRVSGEDLAQQVGLLDGPGTKGEFEARDLVGPLLEMGLDPATYLSLGASALTKKGLDASKGIAGAGKLEGSLLGRIQAGQGGLAGFGLPFSEPSMVLGTGPVSEKIAGTLGNLADKATYSLPGRALGALFDPRVGGALSEPLQRLGRAAAPGIKEGEIGAREAVIGAGRKLGDAGLLEPGNAIHTSDTIRAILEGTASPLPGTAQGQVVGDVANELKNYLGTGLQHEQGLGLPVAELANYAPRQMTPLAKPTSGFAGLDRGQPLSVRNPSMIGREDLFEGLPTQAINQIAKDQALAKLNPIQKADYIRQQFLDPLGRPADAQLKQSTQLADWLTTKLDPQYAEKGLDFFGNHILNDIGTRGMRGARSTGRAEVVHQALAAAATDAASAGPGARKITDVLNDAGLTRNVTNQAGQSTGALDTLAQELLNQGKQGLDYYVPASIASDITRTVQGFTKPESMQPILKAFDSITNLTKAGQISIWPARYARDFVQGVWQNFVHNAYDPRYKPLNPQAWIAPYQDAKALLRDGKAVAGASEIPAFRGLGLTDEEASKKLADLKYGQGVIGGGRMTQAASDVVGGAHAAQSQFHLPGTARESFGEIMGNALPNTLEKANPLNYRGVGGRNETQFSLGRAGEQIMETSEDLNRGAAFIAKMRQGFSPEAAADVTFKAQYEWGKMSGFEQSVMKRLMPFYSWSRANIPRQFEQLLQHPGGKVGQAVRLSNDVRADAGGDFVPEYIADTMSIPLGKEENGKERFLTKLDLPHEDALRLLGTHGVQAALGQLNPLIKAPLELASGKQLYSGRDLADLSSKGLTGNSVADEILSNSPVSRMLTTGRTLLDERKDNFAKLLNLSSPMRLTDVDMEKAREVEARDQVEKLLRGQEGVSNFSRLYVKPDDLAKLSPEQLKLYQLNQTIEREAQAKARAKKPL